MCGWTGNGRPVAWPARATILRTVEVVIGPRRSVTKTYGVSGILPLQPPQGADFRAPERVCGECTVLTPRNVQQVLQIHLVPAQADQFRHPQGMAIGQQIQGGVAVTVTPLAGGRLLQSLTSSSVRYSRLRTSAFFGPRGNFPENERWLKGITFASDPIVAALPVMDFPVLV